MTALLLNTATLNIFLQRLFYQRGKTVRAYVEPSLTVPQKRARVDFVNDQKEPNGRLFQSPKNKVHIDETWYYLERNVVRMLTFPGQELQVRRVRHKGNIIKVMMLFRLFFVLIIDTDQYK